MATDLGDIRYTVTADTVSLDEVPGKFDETAQAAERSSNQVQQSTQRMERGFTGASTAVKALAGAMAALGVTSFFRDVVRESEQLQRNMLRTEALIESTGRAAETTSEQMLEQARSLARATLASTEDIQRSQQILMTFRNVASESFDEVTETALNLATVTGSNVVSVMNQLGRALEDPVRGMTAMTRQGVIFTQQQRDTVQALMDTGREAEAQRIILDELAQQYGGVARREAEGLAGAQDTLAQAIQEAKIQLDETLGLTESATQLYADLASTVEGLTERLAAGEFDRHIEVLRFIGTAVAAGAAAYGTYRVAVAAATAAQVAFNVAARANPVGIAVTGVGLLAAAFVQMNRQAQESADMLDRVRNSAQELYGTMGQLTEAQRQNRIEALDAEIRAAESASDVNRLIEQRSTMLDQLRIAQSQGNEQAVQGFQRQIDSLNEQIAATSDQAENLERLKQKRAELIAEQEKGIQAGESEVQTFEQIESAAAGASQEAQKYIDRLNEQVATQGMTNSQLATYNVLLAGGTQEQAAQAAALAEWLELNERRKQGMEEYENLMRDVEQMSMNSHQQEIMRHSNTLQIIEQLRADDQINHAQYLDAKAAAERAHAAQIKQIDDDLAQTRRQNMQSTLGAMSQMFGNMAQIAQAGGEEQFENWKRMAQAQAAVSAALAITNALASAPPPFNIALAASIGALAAVQVAQIEAMQYQGARRFGGSTEAGGRYLVGEDGPEILQMGSQSGYITPNHKIGGGGDEVNITNSFNINGGGENIRQQIEQMLPMITQATMSGLMRSISKGGDIARAVGAR